MYCTYCGDIADTLDHVTPVKATNIEPKRRNASYAKKVCVPCCRECNSILGSRMYVTVGERAAYLAQRFPKRYKKLLSTPEWDAEELNELSYKLKKMVKKSANEKEAIQQRIKHLKTRSEQSPTIKEVWDEVHEIEGMIEIRFK